MNVILENATYNTRMIETHPYHNGKCIFATKEDFEQVKDKIHPDWLPHIDDCLEQMEYGIDFCFWFDDAGLIRFEG